MSPSETFLKAQGFTNLEATAAQTQQQSDKFSNTFKFYKYYEQILHNVQRVN